MQRVFSIDSILYNKAKINLEDVTYRTLDYQNNKLPTLKNNSIRSLEYQLPAEKLHRCECLKCTEGRHYISAPSEAYDYKKTIDKRKGNLKFVV